MSENPQTRPNPQLARQMSSPQLRAMAWGLMQYDPRTELEKLQDHCAWLESRVEELERLRHQKRSWWPW